MIDPFMLLAMVIAIGILILMLALISIENKTKKSKKEQDADDIRSLRKMELERKALALDKLRREIRDGDK